MIETLVPLPTTALIILSLIVLAYNAVIWTITRRAGEMWLHAIATAQVAYPGHDPIRQGHRAEQRTGLKRMLSRAGVVVCSSLVEDTIRALAPEGKEIIVDHKRLDRAGIEMLRSRLNGLSTPANGSGTPDRKSRARAPRKEK